MREFSRLADRLMARLGDEAVLRGESITPPRRANVEHGVQVEHGDTTMVRSVATMPRSYAAKRGDTLSLTDDTGAVTNYVVDSPPITDDGYLQRFVVRPA
jgi:hypothetical protein